MIYSHKATVIIFSGLTMLSGCDRTPAEKLAIQHSEEQSRVNLAKFQHDAEMREMKKQAEEGAKDND